MNTRYKITKLDEQDNPTLTLEQCKAFFAKQDDFFYNETYIVSANGTQMSISGHFFMWKIQSVEIPFRFFDGEIYVAVSHPAIFDMMVYISNQLDAVYVEG